MWWCNIKPISYIFLLVNFIVFTYVVSSSLAIKYTNELGEVLGYMSFILAPFVFSPAILLTMLYQIYKVIRYAVEQYKGNIFYILYFIFYILYFIFYILYFIFFYMPFISFFKV
jgi:hypothetical protein